MSEAAASTEDSGPVNGNSGSNLTENAAKDPTAETETAENRKAAPAKAKKPLSNFEIQQLERIEVRTLFCITIVPRAQGMQLSYLGVRELSYSLLRHPI